LVIPHDKKKGNYIMERRLNPNSDHSIGQDNIKKPQTGDRKRNPNILEILARQSENLRDKETTPAISLLDAVGDSYGMLGYLVRRGLFLGEKKGQLKKEQITKAYSEARGLMWQAEKVLEKYCDSNGATLDPEMLKKQEKLKESFEKASAPFRKIEEYKDKNALSLLFDNVEEPINTLKEVLEAIKKSELVLDLPVGVSREERGAYVIDLSIVDPADLAKLNLSKLDEITFYGSDKENPKCSNNIPPLINVDRLHSFYQDTLKAGYGLLETNKYSQDDTARYKEVLNFYATFQLYCTLKKTDLKPNDFHNWVREGGSKALSLHRRHVEMLSTAVSQSLDPSEQSNLRETQGTNLSDDSCRKISYADNNIIADISSELSSYIQMMCSKFSWWFGDGHNLRAEREIPQEERYDNSTSMSPFPKKSIERALESEMAVSRAYRDLWGKYEQNPDTEELPQNYILVQCIVDTRIEDIKPEEREGFLNTMREVNQNLKNAAKNLAENMPKGNKDSAKGDIKEKDLKPLQLALRDAIMEIRMAKSWREMDWPAFKKRFDLNDDWVDIKLKKEHIEEICTEHRENDYVRKIIDDPHDIMEIASNCPPDKIVDTYEELIRANASLKHISEQFALIVPAKFEPKRINGRDVLETSGMGCNCLIHALIKVSKPEMPQKKIEKEAASIRQILVNEGWANKYEFLDPQTVRPNRPSVGDDPQFLGDRVIKELIDKGWFDPSRGLVVYQFCTESDVLSVQGASRSRKKQVYCGEFSTEICQRAEEADKPEYALFLTGQDHFQAMSEPRKK
jgi:hypothetical protein